MATMWNPSTWLRMAAKNPPEDQLAQQQAEEEAALPFLLMGNQAAGPQMSFAQPFDQGMTAVAPQPITPTVQPIVPESEPVAPPPPTQQDMSAAAVGQPPVEEDYMAGLDPLARELMTRYQKSLTGQQEQLSLAEKRLLEAQKSKGQMNLAPLARLVDVWTGSNLASAYMPPQSKEKIVQQLQDAVLKARGDLTQSELDMYAKTLGLQQRQEEMKASREDRELRRLESMKAGETATGLKNMKLELEVTEKIGKSDEGKKIKGLTDFVNSLNAYRNLVKKYGLEGNPLGSDAKRDMESAYSDLKIKYKEAANLGALAGPDIGIVVEGIPNAASFIGALKAGVGAGSGAAGIIRTLDQVKDRSNQEFNAAMQNLNMGLGKFGGQQLLQSYNEQFQKVMSGESKPSEQAGYTEQELAAEIAKRKGGGK